MSWGIFKRSDRAAQVQMMRNSTSTVVKTTPANKHSGLSVDLKINGVDESATVRYGEPAELTWTSVGEFISCGLSRTGDDIAYSIPSQGSKSFRDVMKPARFHIVCTTAEYKSVTDSVYVLVAIP